MNKGYSRLIKEDKEKIIEYKTTNGSNFDEIVIDSYNHFTQDLGKTPTIDDIYYDMQNNYEWVENPFGDSPEETELDFIAIIRVLRREELEYAEEDEILNEEATQASAVDGGIVSVFGSNGGNKFDEDNWYKQLFELNDIEETTIEDQYKVASSRVENTGGGTLVEFGRFENGLYYGLNEETLAIYDADYYTSYMNQEEEDLYDWQAKHLINIFAADDMEYNIVANQSKEFKKQIIDEE